jgi:tape measure domain-containing protein
MEIAMSSMLGSVSAGKAMMGALQDFAKSTPFELGEISGAAKQLIAYGVAQDEVVPTMRMLGDIASGLSIPLSDLTYLYGTAAVQGRLFTRDLNQMTSRGIDVVGVMAQQMGKTKTEILQMTEQGKISFSHMNAALIAMTSSGGIFEGMMVRQVNSVAGAWSNLSDIVTIIKARIGRAFSESLNLSGLMQGLAGFGEALATAIIPRVQSLAAWLGQIDFKALGQQMFTWGTVAIKVVGHVVDFISRKVGTAILIMAQLVDVLAMVHSVGAKLKLPGMAEAHAASTALKNAMVTMGNAAMQVDTSSALDAFTADLTKAMYNPMVEVGKSWGQSLMEGMKGALSNVKENVMGGAGGLMAGLRTGWAKIEKDMMERAGGLGLGGAITQAFAGITPEMIAKAKEAAGETKAQEIRDARFAGFGGDAISAAARESHNLRFRKDQQAEPKKQTKILTEIRDAVRSSAVLQVVDVA